MKKQPKIVHESSTRFKQCMSTWTEIPASASKHPKIVYDSTTPGRKMTLGQHKLPRSKRNALVAANKATSRSW